MSLKKLTKIFEGTFRERREVPTPLYTKEFDPYVEDLNYNFTKLPVSLSLTEVKALNEDYPDLVFLTDYPIYGMFRLDVSDITTTGDDILTITTDHSLSSDKKRYKRITTKLLPRYFGAIPNTTSVDNTAALTAMFAYQMRGAIEFERDAYYNVSSSVVIQDKNILSGNPSLDSASVSSLVIKGNGARIIKNGGAITDTLLTIQRCKRIIITDLQVDGTTDIIGLWEGNITNFFSKILRFGYPNPGTDSDQAYNNLISTSSIGLLYIYTGTPGSMTEFNQNTFLNCKFGYGLSSNTLEPIRIYGTANAQSNTFQSCDIYPPSDKHILYVDDTVNDVSLIFEGGTYIDLGIGLADDLKGVKVLGSGLITNPAGAPLEYGSTAEVSAMSICQTSHPVIGSREAISDLNLMVNGNFRDAVSTDFTPTLSAGGLYGRILNLASSAAGKSLFFESIELPFTGYYTISVIGELVSGNEIGSRWDRWDGSSWTEIQYGVILINKTGVITWDSVGVYAEAGQKVRLQLYSQGTGGSTISLYSVALTWGAKAPLIPTKMHYLAGSDADELYTVTSSVSSDTPWSDTAEHGATFENGILKLFSANYDSIAVVYRKGLMDDKFQEFDGQKDFVKGLFALTRAAYNTAADIGVELGAKIGSCVNDTKPFKYRWYVAGDASDGQYITLQVMKCVYTGGVYDPDSEVWEDTGVYLGTDGNWYAPNMVLPSDGWQYWGNPTVDGSYRKGRDGDNLVEQRRESGSWATKNTITP